MLLLGLALVLVLIACRSSEAGPTSGLTPPPGWSALPSLASAASSAAKASKLGVDGIEAWGEPARGCYAAWFSVRGGSGTPDAIATELVKSLSSEPSLMGIMVRDVVTPAAGQASGVLSLSFERGAYHGKLRANVATDGVIDALACFWNGREPAACAQACSAMIGSMR